MRISLFPVSWEKQLAELILRMRFFNKGHGSATAGDLHLLSYEVQTGIGGRRIQGLVAGCYQDHDADWAGEANRLWWRGVVIKRNVSDGNYDPEFVSIDRIKKVYG